MATAAENDLKPAKKNRQAIKRTDLRDRLWPGSETAFWNRTHNKGFTTIPRLLPLIMTLIRSLSGRLDPSMVYLELWARVFDEGLVTISNEKDLAYSAGYTGTRAERTLRERLLKLDELGFIKTHDDGIREFAHILIVNPITTCITLHDQDKVDKAWWAAFVRRAGEIGAELPFMAPAFAASDRPGAPR
jgi:hypothetical protein